jgi:hypothetical protein
VPGPNGFIIPALSNGAVRLDAPLLFPTLPELAVWRHEMIATLRRKHGIFSNGFIDRDDQSGELTCHQGQVVWPPDAPEVTLVTVHPLDCECPEAPHVRKVTRVTRVFEE